jgi:hypothetical protein
MTEPRWTEFHRTWLHRAVSDRAVSDRGGRRAAVAAALAWLVHPVTLAATALLILNDHLLKAADPGLLTGKLSDIAGLVMAPPTVAVPLAVLLPRVRPVRVAAAAVALIGLGFVAVKASPHAAGYASAAWSLVNGPSRISADITDLVALPALGLAWLTWLTATARPARSRLARLVATLVVLPTAGMAMAATSAAVYDDAIAITQWHGAIVVGVGNAYFKQRGSDRHWMSSTDGGLTFSYRLPGDAGPSAAPSAASPSAVPTVNGTPSPTGYVQFLNDLPTLPMAGPADCVASDPGHCFRVVAGHLRVEETVDGGADWRIAWQVTDAQRKKLADDYSNIRSVDEYLASLVLLVAEQPGGGFVVLVANGRDGFARRNPSGVWERIGFGARLLDDGEVYQHAPLPIPS